SIKGRPENQPIALLVPSIDVAKKAVRFSSRAARLAEEFWPGPLTLVLPERAPLHPALGKDGRVGVRVPGPSPALDIAVAFAGALTATSANRSGEPSANRIEELGPILERGVDIVIPLPAPGGPPSTLLVEDGSEFRVIREGAIEAARLTAVLAAIESPGG
ncbi:MAG: Sua5/YciO/YrdC/YwlC family protein, partial [Myxococcota bacterium]